MKKETFYCCQCKQHKPKQKSGGTGYAIKRNGHKVCYDCCGENDKKHLLNMKLGDKWYLYLSKDEEGRHKLTNWPGTLTIPIAHVRTGNHNIARNRYDLWFTYGGGKFHGVQYGDMTQICHIRRIAKF